MMTPPPPLRVGLIGCGNISNAYFQGLGPFAGLVRIEACADLDPGRARAKAAEHGVAKAFSVADLLADPGIDAVLNLTVPQAHAETNLRALRAGKHAYCEKPFSLTVAEGRKVLAEAKRRRLLVGCAPDTVLGGGIQTCRGLIDAGAIGKPVSFAANMLCHGHEHWHPNPEFYYLPGGGPLFDMGPYYLTALVAMIGPIRSVSALAAAAFRERTITSVPLRGKKIRVKTPTHLCAAVELEQGAIGTVTMSFDVWQSNAPLLEVHGTEGSLSCPDPNCFGGEVRLHRKGDAGWRPVPPTHSTETGRGLGLADMALSIARRRKESRMNGTMALHVVEAMEAFQRSAKSGRRVVLRSPCRRPAALPPAMPPGRVE